MRPIDADAKITALLYDEEHEETNRVEMTIADFLDSHTEEGCPQIGGWISVKDRLPTYAELRDDHVLVLFEDGTISSIGFDECIEGESIFGEWRQYFDMETLGATDSEWMPIEGVTHWMAMPEPPKDDE